jgi:hypothetical protein
MYDRDRGGRRHNIEMSDTNLESWVEGEIISNTTDVDIEKHRLLTVRCEGRRRHIVIRKIIYLLDGLNEHNGRN